MGKKLILVGDRVLVAPMDGDDKSSAIYLPQAAIDAQAIQMGTVWAIGPGIPVGMPNQDGDPEPWKKTRNGGPLYFPIQPKVHDIATFFRRAAVEVKWKDKKYLVVPQDAILLLEREESNVIEPGELEAAHEQD